MDEKMLHLDLTLFLLLWMYNQVKISRQGEFQLLCTPEF